MRMRSLSTALALGGALLLLGAGFPDSPTSTENRGLDPSNLDPTTPASKDFFQYANGGWLSRNPVPPDYSRYGAFEELMEKNYLDLHGVLDEAAANSAVPKGGTVQRVGDLYASAMDSVQAEQAGIAPLAPVLARIDGIQGRTDLSSIAGFLHVHGITGLFNFFVAQDAKISTDQIAQLYQGGLGLPDRDYYTKDDDRSRTIRDEYVKHVAKTLELGGMTPVASASAAKTVMEIETELAKASMTRVQRRDPNATYHKMGLGDLQDLAGAFDWSAYFSEIGRPGPGALNVAQPEFFRALSRLLAERQMGDWKSYFRWHLLHSTAPQLNNAFVQENFRFYGTTLTGAKELRPRWKRALDVVNDGVGEALGILYVRKYFPPQARDRAREMVNNLKEAFRERIQNRQWMSDQTRAKALAKLDAFGVKIGYPEKWRDYTGLEIDRGPVVLNIMRADSFEFKRVLNRIGQPVDRTEWGMTPPTVNAYYNPSRNEIVFPAGILQPPFFDPAADDAVNYGGMGAVIGHEMTHGFDDQGSQFDAKGNLADWWSPTDKIAFTARTKMVEREFSDFVAIDTSRVNGKLTLGENIADLGGLTIAYAALQKALAKHPAPEINGMTPPQRFFLAWAQIWRANYRPEELRRRLIIDPHSPGRFRTIGPLVNIDAFYAAFNVKDGDPMWRPEKDRAHIW